MRTYIPSIFYFIMIALLSINDTNAQEIVTGYGIFDPTDEFVIDLERENDLNKITFEDQKVFWIQVIGENDWANYFERKGIQVLEYLPDNCYHIAVPVDFSPNSMPEIRTSFLLPNEWKILSSLKKLLLDRKKTFNCKVIVQTTGTFPSKVINSTLRNQDLCSGEILWSGKEYLIFNTRLDHIVILSKLPWVISIQEYTDRQPLLYKSHGTHRLRSLVSEHYAGLSGTGITIGVGDGGKIGSHIDLDGHYDSRTSYGISSHATCVTGIVGGRHNLDLFKSTGIAPSSNLLIAYFSQIIDNANSYYSVENMTITNNSYGAVVDDCNIAGDYDVLSIQCDDQISTLGNLQHVFAAGNDGSMPCPPYPVGYGTVLGGYQSAKNILTVGGVTHLDAAYGNSSKGPVDDGRVKPEIVAVGRGMIGHRPNNNFANGTGTSYSSPMVSGILGLLSEAWEINTGMLPSAAVLKSVVCNTAEDLGNLQVDYAYGFGRINASRALDVINNGWIEENTISDGQMISNTISVPTGASQLRVMLYWNDEAGSVMSTNALVNDLDLVVNDPSSNQFLPWGLNQADPLATATRKVDHINNIEQVTIDNPTAGMYTIDISGFDIPMGSQDYSITWDIVMPGIILAYPYGGETFSGNTREYIKWEANGTGSSTYTVEYSLDNGSTWTILDAAVPATQKYYDWNTVPSLFSETAKVRVTANGTSYADVNSDPFSIMSRSALTVAELCDGYADLSWTAIPDIASYEVLKLIDGHMQVIGTTTGTNFTAEGLLTGETYWFAIQGIGPGGNKSVQSIAKPILTTGTSNCLWNNDGSIVSISSPIHGRQNTSSELTLAESISITIRNPGNNSIASVPVNYQINGGSIISETYVGTILSGSEASYTFSQTADLSSTGDYSLKVWTSLTGDIHNINDTLSILIRHAVNPVITLPMLEDFESSGAISQNVAAFAPTGIEALEFVSSGNGRIRTSLGPDFAFSGSSALTTDTEDYGTLTSNELIFTYNLSSYSVAAIQLRLNFAFMHHEESEDDDLLDNVWIRGSDTDTWIEVYDLFANHYPAGIYNHENTGIDLSQALADNGQEFSSSFQIKFGQEGTASADIPDLEDGYSFDDIELYQVKGDIRMLTVINPHIVNCGLSSNENIQVEIENTSNFDLTNVDIQYQINGGITSSVEVIPLISANSTITYTFSQTADFSSPGFYDFSTWLYLAQDNYRLNDTIKIKDLLYVEHINTYPYLEEFEVNSGGFFTNGTNPSWEHGIPTGTAIDHAAEGASAWVTGLSGNHNYNERSYLYTPCFDVSGMANPAVSFAFIRDIEDNYDYSWMEYSTDGEVWAKLGSSSTGI